MVVVVKVGGSILGGGVSASILSDIKALQESEKIVLVHGGGDEVTAIAEKLGKEQKFVVSPEGIRSRYTDRETASIYTMVMAGRLNKEMVAALQKVGVRAVGLCGLDGAILQAERKKKLIVVDERGRKMIIDGGYTGKISHVNGELIHMLLDHGYTPIISPVALSMEYEPLNVDGDRAAAYVAGGVKASKAVFLTDVSGVLMDNQLVNTLDLKEAEEMLPRIGFGMEKKVLACVEALKMGVKESIIASGLVENPILSAVKHKECTVISP
ncbi:MAG: [LysW]-aminoadipate/[LysW]-glutamate kinase [Thaumarchaeota archaeon]|nr:[LysW]-aminoadipate/[LysW]-glutamate kinase [Nitrososphaerota archaeon]